VAICAIVNLIAIFFFFPETQYFRDSMTHPMPADASSTEKETSSTKIEPALVSSLSDNILPTPRKSYLKELNPWSGINPGIPKAPIFSFFLFVPFL